MSCNGTLAAASSETIYGTMISSSIRTQSEDLKLGGEQLTSVASPDAAHYRILEMEREIEMDEIESTQPSFMVTVLDSEVDMRWPQGPPLHFILMV